VALAEPPSFRYYIVKFMNDPTATKHKPTPACDLLLFVVTKTELEQLQRAASELGISIDERVGRLGTYYDLGRVGTNRVLAIKTTMGPFTDRGSASQAIHYLTYGDPGDRPGRAGNGVRRQSSSAAARRRADQHWAASL
jgi:hypothetical protein